jgi:uncharacterized OB-fold protein
MGQGQASGEPVTAGARPYPDPVSPLFAGYLDGLDRGELVIRACATCGARQWPPRSLCGRCRGRDFGLLPIGGDGVVHTFTVVHRAFDPWFASRVPFGIVVADLGDGIRMTGNYLGADLDELECGLPVRAAFERTGGHTYLGWAPRAAGAVR